MAITLYNSEGGIVTYHDLQDKRRWCKDGESLEQSFVRRYPHLGYIINPEKANDPFVPDLLNTETNIITDLKSQHSPFFKSKVLYDIEPTYAVVFNLKDKERYERHYPSIDILYFIEWIPIRADIYGKVYSVQPHSGIYRTSFKNLLSLLVKSPIHSYQQRVSDTQGNAKDSYVLDIRNEIFERLT